MAGSHMRPPVLAHGHVVTYLDSLSKATLADFVVDLIRAAHGAELDDVELLARIDELIGPVLLSRELIKDNQDHPVADFFAAQSRRLEKLAQERPAHVAPKFRESAQTARLVADLVRGGP